METGHTATPWHKGDVIEVAINGERNTFASIHADGFVAGGGVALVHVKSSDDIDNAEFIVRAVNAYPDLTKAANEHAWLMDCARKTGITVRFVGEQMVVSHGATNDSVVDGLVSAAEKARRQLKLWMKDHGQDIGSQEAIAAIDAALLAATSN